MLSTLAIFVPTCLLLAMVPGPDFAIVVRTSLVHGKRAALFSSLGIAGGFCVHTSLSLLGLSAVIAHSIVLLNCITYAGAAYLAWLGIQALRARPAKPGGATAGTTDGTADGPRRGGRQTPAETLPDGKAFRQGFLTNLLNPKVLIYFLTFFPQFLVHDSAIPLNAQLLTLGVLSVALTGGWFVFLSLMLAKVRRHFESETFRKRLERITGIIFLGFSVRLLASGN